MMYKMKTNIFAAKTTTKHRKKYNFIAYTPPIVTSSYAHTKKDLQKKKEEVLQTIRKAENVMAEELKTD